MVQVSTSRETAKFWHNFALLLFSNKCIENWKANQGYIIPHFKKIFKSLKKIYPWLIVTYIGLSNIVLKWYYQVNSSLKMTLTDIFLYLKHLSINISTVFVIKNGLLLIQYITDSLLSKPFSKWKANYTKRHQHYEKEHERQVSQIKMKVLRLF